MARSEPVRESGSLSKHFSSQSPRRQLQLAVIACSQSSGCSAESAQNLLYIVSLLTFDISAFACPRLLLRDPPVALACTCPATICNSTTRAHLPTNLKKSVSIHTVIRDGCGVHLLRSCALYQWYYHIPQHCPYCPP